jgi:hypothetical protein
VRACLPASRPILVYFLPQNMTESCLDIHRSNVGNTDTGSFFDWVKENCKADSAASSESAQPGGMGALLLMHDGLAAGMLQPVAL